MGSRQQWADGLGILAAAAVLAFGGLLVLGPSLTHWDEVWDRDPFSVRVVKTSQTKNAYPGQTKTPGTTKTTTTTTVAPNGDRTVITAVEQTNATTAQGGRATETTTTTGEASDSLLERSLSTGGLVLLRLAIVAFAAFIAGAVVQRAVLGRFALKLGVLELDDVKTATTGSVDALQVRITELGTEDKTLSNSIKKQAAATKKAVAALASQIEEVEKRLPPPTAT